MKKIVNPIGKIRLMSGIDKNGIAFRANDGVRLSLGSFASVNESGEIIWRDWNGMQETEVEKKIDKLMNVTSIVLGILIFLSIVSVFVFSYLGMKEIGIIFAILTYIISSMHFIKEGITIFIARLLGDKEMRSFSKFLSAKNAIENAYYSLSRVPTIEEAKSFSTFSSSRNEYVGNTFFVTDILAVGFMYSLFTNLLAFFIMSTLVAIVTILLYDARKLFFWQFLVISKPEDIHYETGIKALEEAIEQLEASEVIGF